MGTTHLSAETQHFIVVYDVDTAEVDVTTYPPDRATEAINDFRRLEAHQFLAEPKSRKRILYFSASHEAALRITHRHYFTGKAARFEDESWDESLTRLSS